MTRECTLHGFLTRETQCTPLPVPADYPDPCRGYGFLEGMGIGHREVTWGLPVPITRKGHPDPDLQSVQNQGQALVSNKQEGPSRS